MIKDKNRKLKCYQKGNKDQWWVSWWKVVRDKGKTLVCWYNKFQGN